MKTIIMLCLGFAAGLYFADYRAVRFVKRETKAALSTWSTAADRKMR